MFDRLLNKFTKEFVTIGANMQIIKKVDVIYGGKSNKNPYNGLRSKWTSCKILRDVDLFLIFMLKRNKSYVNKCESIGTLSNSKQWTLWWILKFWTIYGHVKCNVRWYMSYINHKWKTSFDDTTFLLESNKNNMYRLQMHFDECVTLSNYFTHIWKCGQLFGIVYDYIYKTFLSFFKKSSKKSWTTSFLSKRIEKYLVYFQPIVRRL